MRNYKQYPLPELHYTGGETVNLKVDILKAFGNNVVIDTNSKALVSVIPFSNRYEASSIFSASNYALYEVNILPPKTVLYSNTAVWSENQYSHVIGENIANICNETYFLDGKCYRCAIGTKYDCIYTEEVGIFRDSSGVSYSYIGKLTDPYASYTLYVIKDYGILVVSEQEAVIGSEFLFSLELVDPIPVRQITNSGDGVALDLENGILTSCIEGSYTRELSGKYIYQITLSLDEGDIIRQGIMWIARNIEAN